MAKLLRLRGEKWALQDVKLQLRAQNEQLIGLKNDVKALGENLAEIKATVQRDLAEMKTSLQSLQDELLAAKSVPKPVANDAEIPRDSLVEAQKAQASQRRARRSQQEQDQEDVEAYWRKLNDLNTRFRADLAFLYKELSRVITPTSEEQLKTLYRCLTKTVILFVDALRAPL
jgi:hypothetical protein